MDSLGKRLKKMRAAKGWTLKEVAKRLGLKGHSTYSNWEYDRTEPDREMLIKLSEVMGCPPSYLLGKADDIEKHDPILNKLKDLLEQNNLDLGDTDTFEMIKKVIEVVAINQHKK
ncbi:helix-turn-helix domain-containing protein [Paenibacillus sinopodophylli]|uniref:helix-turn-helix domain-containing protein n=1 Tax=Paenibacillus sinopodophylli TaxID=1837342 RepID=UPI00110CD96D|nr:helix-turn-helix transcriptional regulator [Paenibacillus sinopodophylli]